MRSKRAPPQSKCRECSYKTGHRPDKHKPGSHHDTCQWKQYEKPDTHNGRCNDRDTNYDNKPGKRIMNFASVYENSHRHDSASFLQRQAY